MPQDNLIKKITRKVGKALLVIVPVFFLSVAVYSFGIFNKEGEALIPEEKPTVKGTSTISALSFVEKIINLPPESSVLSQDKTLCGVRVNLISKNPADKILSYYLSQMPNNGWNIYSSASGKVEFKKDNQNLEIRILEQEENETLVEIKLTV